MKPREISSRSTFLYKLLPIVIFFGIGIPLIPMYDSNNQWGCVLGYKNQPRCQQITPTDITSGRFSSPLSEDEQQAAFYWQRDSLTLLFIVFLIWTMYIAFSFKQVKIDGNSLIIANFIRTTRVPFSRVIDAKINFIPARSITIRLMDLSPLGDCVTFVPHLDIITTQRELETLITTNRPET